MDPFPEEWELLSLFEVEPQLTDHDIPWCYNCLAFETIRNNDHIRCEIEPGNEIIRLNWRQDQNERLSLELNWVHGLQVVTGEGCEYFIASFRDEHLKKLEFHLKPTICLRWGTCAECP